MKSRVRSLGEGLTPDPNINFLDWANRYFYLPRESSAEHGRYRSSRTPMVEEILKELSPNSPTQEIVVMKPTQLAGTTAGIIVMLAVMDISPGPGLLIEPTADLAKSFSKKKFQPAINSTITGSGRLKGKISDVKSRDSSNTILEKTFPGGSWRLAGSNSPAVYRGESVRYMILDDFDGFDSDIGGEGDPGELADRRTGTFPNRKIYKNSTPTIKGVSNIERAYNGSSKGKFHVPCPHCKELQYLIFRNVKFERDSDGVITDCWYECEHCHQRIDEHEKTWMLTRGRYVHEHPKREIRGFHYNALYTPAGWVNTWKKIAQLFLDAKDNVEKLQAWNNTLMAEPFEQHGIQPGWEVLLSKCEPYKPLVVPEGGYVLTAGVDVQDNRLAVRIDAWGENEENWCIYWVELFGDPGADPVWEQLDGLIERQYDAPHIMGGILRIVSVGVDSGGHHTQRVYDYCRRRQPIVFALTGVSTRNKPIIGRPSTPDVTWMGQTIKNGVQLWPVGTDTAKSLVYSRLNMTKSAGSLCHFYIGLEEDFFKQLTAEKLVTRFVKGYPTQDWVLIGHRNEALDCTIYSYAAALRAGLKQADWKKIKGVKPPPPQPVTSPKRKPIALW